MSKFKSAITVNESKPMGSISQPLKCAAECCGLNGTLSAGTDGTAKFYCRWHHGKPFTKNQAISNVLNFNPQLFLMLDYCSNPDLIVKADPSELIFDVADSVIGNELEEMGLGKLFVKKNLLITRNNIMKHIDEKVAKV